MVLLLSLIVAFYLGFKGRTNIMKCDNVTDKQTLITELYSTTEINSIREAINAEGMSFEELVKKFRVQCLRETYQGYYVVLLSDDGSSNYVFIDDNMQVYKVMTFQHFLSNCDFDNLHTLDEVIMLDTNHILLPTSAVAYKTTLHIVQEGVLIIQYALDVSEENYIIHSSSLIDNEDIISNSELLRNMPYILEIDKYID